MLNWNGNYRKLACCSSLVRISSLSNSLFICHIVWPKILSALLGDYTQINVTSRPLKVKQQDHWLSFNVQLDFAVQNPLLLWSGEGETFLNFTFCELWTHQVIEYSCCNGVTDQFFSFFKLENKIDTVRRTSILISLQVMEHSKHFIQELLEGSDFFYERISWCKLKKKRFLSLAKHSQLFLSCGFFHIFVIL